MTAALIIEAARILTSGAIVNHPNRIVTFAGEGSEGVVMHVKPMPRSDGKHRSLSEEWKACRSWRIARNGDSYEMPRT